MSRRRKLLFTALALFIGSVLAIYASEIAFRHLLLVPTVPETDSDFEKIVASRWPRPVDPARAPGTVRLLGLADSFGLAGGAHNYHYRVENILRERGYPVEMVNLSVSAYSLDRELALLERFGPRYSPDLVIHGFFVGNDFAIGEPQTLRYDGIDIERLSGPSSWLPHRLTLARWLSKRVEGVAEQRRQSVERDEGQGEGSFSRSTFLSIERVRFGACRRPRSRGPAWPMTTDLLDGIRKEVRQLDAEHVLVVHPDQFQVEPRLAEEIIETFELDRSEYDLNLPQRFLEAYATSRGVRLVDLTPAFRESGSDGGLYLPRDTHYNDAGNALAAEVLADALEPIVARIVGDAHGTGDRPL